MSLCNATVILVICKETIHVLSLPYSQKILRINISHFCQILLINKFLQIKFSWSSFQPRLASVMNFKFLWEKFFSAIL